ncbi:hypothetical protein ACIGFK_19360 [Streptomyces sp. NPDC085524]|uniref:hypothetical protein n=1 Tax=unclassified Streptomyces TaxID=2593676 RepID=UPI0035DF99A8
MEAVRGAERLTVGELLAAAQSDQSGALWRLEGDDRQLDANLVRHLPGTGGTLYTEDEVDVLLIVVTGSGTLTHGRTETSLSPGYLGLLPRGTPRALLAGPDGLVVLTAHRRRPGLRIAPAPSANESLRTCLLHKVCGRCHRHAIEADARYCTGCGTRLERQPPAG